MPQLPQKLRSTSGEELKNRLATPLNCTEASSNPTNAARGEAVARRQLSQWQYAVQRGLLATENLTAPQRQPPLSMLRVFIFTAL